MITSTLKLKSFVMLGVFKIQVVFLGSWETDYCTWSPSMAVSPSVLDWPLLQAFGKMRSWQKAEKGIHVSLEKRYKSLRLFIWRLQCWRRGFYLFAQFRQEILLQAFFAPHCAKPVIPFSWHFLPHQSLKDFKRDFPLLQKEPDMAFLTHPAFEALISNMWLAPNCRLSQPFKKILLIVKF